MCHSNVVFRVKLVLFVLVCTALSACSSLPIESNKTTSEKEAGSVNKSGEQVIDDKNIDSEQMSIRPTAIDPMADIKINTEIKKIYSQVSKLDKKSNFLEAISLLDKIEVKYPQLSGPSYQKARILLRQEKYNQALEQAELSISKNKRNYYSHNLKAVILRTKGDFQASKSAYMDALNAYPGYPNSHLNLGVLADLYLRDLPLALSHYQNYMRLVKNQDEKVKNWIIEIQRRIQLEKK